jgi:hypothetical protein
MRRPWGLTAFQSGKAELDKLKSSVAEQQKNIETIQNALKEAEKVLGQIDAKKRETYSEIDNRLQSSVKLLRDEAENGSAKYQTSRINAEWALNSIVSGATVTLNNTIEEGIRSIGERQATATGNLDNRVKEGVRKIEEGIKSIGERQAAAIGDLDNRVKEGVRKISTEISAASKAIVADSLKIQLEPLNTHMINLQKSMIYLQAAEVSKNLDAEDVNNIKSMIYRGLISEFNKINDIQDVYNINILIKKALMPDFDFWVSLGVLSDIVGNWLHESDHQAVSGKCSSAHFSIGYKMIGFHNEIKLQLGRGKIDLSQIKGMTSLNNLQGTREAPFRLKDFKLEEPTFEEPKFLGKPAFTERYQYFLFQDNIIILTTINARLALRYKDAETLELLRFKWQGKDAYKLPKMGYGVLFKKCSE